MPGHLLLYHPRRPEAEGDSRLRRARRGARASTATAQNLGTFRTNENALWSLGVHDLSVLPLPDRRGAERGATAHGNAFLSHGVEDVVFCYLRFPSGKIAHMHLSWLDPHKIRRITVVGSEKMAVFDDMERERKITVYDKARSADEPRTGDIYSPNDRRDGAAAASSASTSCAWSPARATARRPRATRFAWSCALDQLQASLETVAPER